MRKRSKYRPKPVLQNPVGYVLESLKPVALHDSLMMDLRIKNHAAMANLTRGEAKRHDIDVLIAMVNMTEALHRLGFGNDYNDIVVAGLAALRSVGKRGAESGRFILRSEELRALNEIVDLHDAQLEAINLKDMERAIAIVSEEFRQKKATPITA